MEWAWQSLAALLFAAACSKSSPGSPKPPPDLRAILGSSVGELVGAVDRARYEANLRLAAVVRNHGSPAWQRVQDLCADQLVEYGYEVERQRFPQGVNVIGTKRGRSDETIVVSAHYDAVENCQGADDNATGVAGVLETARVLSELEFERTLVVACWDQEENGLLGSRAYARAARARGENIVGMYSFEMIGFVSDVHGSQEIPPGFDLLFPDQVAAVRANGSRGDFIAVVSDARSSAMNRTFAKVASALGLPCLEFEVPSRLLTSAAITDLRRSDHAAFWDVGYPGTMLTDSANFRNPRYHCRQGQDTPDVLSTPFAVNVVRSVVGAVGAELGPVR